MVALATTYSSKSTQAKRKKGNNIFVALGCNYKGRG